MTKLEELKQRHAELKGQILEESKAWFKEAAAGLFAKYPAMQSFKWRQYTPYFNDGEECTFSVHSEPDINGHDSYDIRHADEAEKVPEAAFEEVQALIESIENATLKEMFGDHCEVTAKRDGITVEEYGHD